jgi:hypothetical protein
MTLPVTPFLSHPTTLSHDVVTAWIRLPVRLPMIVPAAPVIVPLKSSALWAAL